jgi:hypothetical protein
MGSPVSYFIIFQKEIDDLARLQGALMYLGKTWTRERSKVGADPTGTPPPN